MNAGGERGGVVIARTDKDRGDDTGGKSPREIENDIADTRAQLGAILDEIERRLSPRQLLEEGIDMLKDTMGDRAGRLGDTLRASPLALAAIGAGLGWLVFAATRGGDPGAHGGARREPISDAAPASAGASGEAAVEEVAGTPEKVEMGPSPEPYATGPAGYAYAREKSEEAADQAGPSAEAAAAKPRHPALLEEHPLAVAALGFVAGAAIGLALPRSGLETRIAGDAAERLRERAARLGREAVERAQRVAERTVRAASDAVREALTGASGAEGQAPAGARMRDAGESVVK